MEVFSIPFAFQIMPLILSYLPTTMLMSLLALVCGLCLAILIATMVELKIPILFRMARIHVSFFRGTPLIGQLFLLYFGLVQIFPFLTEMSAFTAAVIGLTMNSSAYMSESIRGGIQSVAKGEIEAGLSFGMPKLLIMRRIVLPQAARVAIPALSNNYIDIIKGSSLAFTIGVTEIMATAQMEGASAYRFFEAFTVVMLIYWIIISLFTMIQKRLEKQMNRVC